MSNYAIEKGDGYCAVCFRKEFAEMQPADVEGLAEPLATEIAAHGAPRLLVDVSDVDALPQGTVTFLIRLHRLLKESCRKFVVATPHEAARKRLHQGGVDGLWSIVEDVQAAWRDITGSDRPEYLQRKPDIVPDAQARPFTVEEQRGYCSVRIHSVAPSMNWTDVERATTEVIEQLKKSPNVSVMVDLSELEFINSGLVASLVRIWKTVQSRRGQFSLASPNDMVTEVLKTAGLWKLWPIVEDREDAVYELGAGEVAEVERRERRLLMLVSVPCALLAAVALTLKYSGLTPAWGANAHQVSLLLAAASIATGMLSLAKDTGWRRALSLFAVILSIGVLSSLFFDENPVAIGRELLRIPEEFDDTGFPIRPDTTVPGETEEEDASSPVAPGEEMLNQDESSDDTDSTPDSEAEAPAASSSSEKQPSEQARTQNNSRPDDSSISPENSSESAGPKSAANDTNQQQNEEEEQEEKPTSSNGEVKLEKSLEPLPDNSPDDPQPPPKAD